MESGVYKIENTVSGDIYVGSSKRIGARCNNHLNELRKGKHCNEHIQRSWNKYGEENFVFTTLEHCECVKEILIAREQYYIEMLHPQFNMNPMATNNLGYVFGPHTAEHNAKISAAEKGRKCGSPPQERRDRISKALMGKPGPWLGKKRSPETCAKMSATMKAKGAIPGQTDAMHQWCKGRPLPPEHRAKLSAALMGKPFTMERRMAISKANTGKRLSPERCANLSVAQYARWARVKAEKLQIAAG